MYFEGVARQVGAGVRVVFVSPKKAHPPVFICPYSITL